MDFADIGQDIIKAAPLLGSLIGGPAGGAVGTLLAAKFGGSSNNVDDLVKKMNDDPQRDIKLAEIESNNEIQLQNLVITSENNRMTQETNQLKIQSDENASARQRQVDLAKAGHPDFTNTILALSFQVGYFGMLIFYSVYPQYKDQAITATLNAVEMLIFGYYFGSSIGSKIKDVLMARQKTPYKSIVNN